MDIDEAMKMKPIFFKEIEDDRIKKLAATLMKQTSTLRLTREGPCLKSMRFCPTVAADER